VASWQLVSDGDEQKGPVIPDALDREAGRAALRELGTVVHEILAQTGLSEDELIRQLGGD
jgi:uncharacterized protein YidB (DUF937 family)